MIVNGFIEPLVKELPMEYAVEMNRLDSTTDGGIGRLDRTRLTTPSRRPSVRQDTVPPLKVSGLHSEKSKAVGQYECDR